MKQTRKPVVVRHFRALFESGSLSGLSDSDLLARFVNADVEQAELAFSVLVERHASTVQGICKAILGNASDAEDAFQATFLVLATKAGRLTVRETLSPWLASVARRIARRARARAQARAARELRAAKLAGVVITPSTDREDDAEVLHEEIERLPDRYRLPVLICDLESQSYQQAALRLGWPLGTVKSRHSRARERLRARLSRRGFSGALPIAFQAKSAPSVISNVLTHSTARAAVTFTSRGAAAQTVSASVSTLVSNALRTMIMTRLSVSVGVLLTLCAGVAATVWAQATPDNSGYQEHVVAALATADLQLQSPAFEYEIRIWKDGAPVTPTMRMRAHPNEPSLLKLPEGTVSLNFQPASDSAAIHVTTLQPGTLAAIEQALTLSNKAQAGVSSPLGAVLKDTLRLERGKPMTSAANDPASRLAVDLAAQAKAIQDMQNSRKPANDQSAAIGANERDAINLAPLAKALQDIQNSAKPAQDQSSANKANEAGRAGFDMVVQSTVLKDIHDSAKPLKNPSFADKLNIKPDRAPAQHDKNEARLAEIERKLERILKALDRGTAEGLKPPPPD
jgi:RNA polymerase sigma factor (sigma-70 family)